MKIGEKVWINLNDLISLILTIQFTIQNLQLQMLHYPVTKQFCVAVCTMKPCFISEWVTPANPHFFINEILNFETSIVIQIFHLFLHWITLKLSLCCTFCKLFMYYGARKFVRKLTVIQTSIFPQYSVKICSRPKCLFLGFVLFWRTKWVSLDFAINKTPNSLTIFISANSAQLLCKA